MLYPHSAPGTRLQIMIGQSITRLQRMSKNFRLLFTALIFVIPVADLLYWIYFNQLSDGFTSGLPAVPYQALSLLSLTLAFFASLIPLSVAVYGIATLRKLFGLYENGIVFSEENVALFRKLGYAMIAWVFANLIFVPLISIILTFENPAGQRMLTIGFDVSDLAALIIGAIIVLISRVMDEGRKLEDEQMHTV